MGRLVPAVTRALDVLELFLESEGPLSAPDVIRRLQLPRTTVHELLTTLAARSYLDPLPGQPGRYRLGVRTYQLGSRYAEQLDLAAEGQQVAREVAETCDETVHVAVLEDTDVIYIAKVDSTHAVRMVSAAGRRLPAHCTSVGKMLLASLTEDELERRFSDDASTAMSAATTLTLTAMTPDSITDPEVLRAELARTRERGVAVEHRESNPDVSCVAAPVRDSAGRVVAALSISVPMIRWSDRREEELARLAVEGADALSVRLGHRGRR
ncbi:IclR family transcriptional regulator [Streptomyces sp. NPDC087420]|uniref:IclR family transcriptional regulator n=1 Tax=Streptomyces sp. NPDC087420 TaxID=3365785 RepID=UPI003835865F